MKGAEPARRAAMGTRQGLADGRGRLLTALVTPLAADGEVDTHVAAELAADLCARGCDGFVVAATTGESPTLSEREKLSLCAAVRRAVDGRASVWLGTGSYDTRSSIELTREAAAAGAQGVMAVVPYYSRPPQAGLVRHFTSVAAATDLPLMVYNIPARTGCNLLPATLARIVAEAPNVVALKESSRDLEQVAEVVRLLPALDVYSGDDGLTLPVLAVGGCGVVSVAAHIVPEAIAALIHDWEAGRTEAARARHLALLPLYRALFLAPNPIPVKTALRLRGWAVGGLRPPLCELEASELAALRAALSSWPLSQPAPSAARS